MFLHVISLTLVVALSSAVPTSHSPSFCHDLDCPTYSVVQTFKEGYELRRYAPSKWVATNITTIEYTDEINRELFYKLFYYISGNNSAHMKIPMTAPVLRTVIHGAGPACEDEFVTHFMVPHNMQTNTPTPTDPKAYLVTIPEMLVYVKSFPGRPTDSDRVAKIDELAQEIGDPSKYHDDYFYFAGYDGPYVVARHNEVWLAAKN